MKTKRKLSRTEMRKRVRMTINRWLYGYKLVGKYPNIEDAVLAAIRL